ncbi:MFS general substrate transporter [Thozetella sp. PMI_491]|nr:MFS general substrate transporter [Thozetella sp. PMI_491]
MGSAMEPGKQQTLGVESEIRLEHISSTDNLESGVSTDNLTQDCSSNEPDPGINEKRLKWKLDLYIMPMLISIFFLAQMGRSDIGNAKSAGMDDELQLTPGMFSNIGSMFLVGYIIGQLPGTLLLRILGPQYQFAGAMLSWGLFTVGAALVQNYVSLLVVRLFTGLSEAFIQGAVFYLSFWYKYNELGFRGSLLSSTVALAGAFNGLLAYAIQQNLDGHNGWAAWRWIFLIEGVLPIGWCFLVAIFLPPTPEAMRWGVSPAEKVFLVRRAAEAHNTGSNKVNLKLVPRVLIDPQFWMLALTQAGLSMCLSSMSNFLPDIMEGLGYTDIQAQLMTVIVYATMFVSILITARISDKMRMRGVFILGWCVMAAIGYIILLSTTNLPARFVATCFVACGANAPVVLNLAWMASANVGYTYRGSALGFINIVAHLIGIGGNQAYRDPPLYHKGMAISLAVILVSAVMTVCLMVYFRYMNNKKRQQQNSPEADELRAFSIDEIGNRHPDFFFTF